MSTPYGPPGPENPPQWGQQQPPGYPQQGYPQQSYPHQGYPQPGYPQPGYAPPGYPQHGYPPPGYPPPGYPQQGNPQQGHPQQEYPQQGYQAYEQQQIGHQPYPGEPYPGGYDQSGNGGSPKKSALPWVLSGLGGVIVLGVTLVLGFVVPGFFTTTVFDQKAVQGGVQRILTEEYGQHVEAVSCPAGQEVQVGSRFTCQATIDGEPRQVTITVRTEGGEYEVARPN
ncbi:MAG: DUF4333 domain-containing protein [Pseudonocardiaceae bacterium]